MNIRVVRDTPTLISTIGKMFVNNPTAYCQTLEPPIKTDGSKPRAIPCGTYPLTVRYSPRFKRDVPHIENVLGFSDVEIHIGNSAEDTHACVLTGKTRGEDYIYHSGEMFEPLLKLLIAVPGPHSITIEEAFPCPTESSTT